MSAPKYQLGETIWWVYSSTHYGKRVPCPMCFGKRRVTLVLGDGSSLPCECEACRHGIESPNGMMDAWEPVALVKSGAVTGVFSESGAWRYEAGHERLNESEVFGTLPEAEAAREIAFVEVSERAAHYCRDNFINVTKKQLWSAGYHRNQIKYNEDRADWHRARLCMTKEKQTCHDNHKGKP